MGATKHVEHCKNCGQYSWIYTVQEWLRIFSLLATVPLFLPQTSSQPIRIELDSLKNTILVLDTHQMVSKWTVGGPWLCFGRLRAALVSKMCLKVQWLWSDSPNFDILPIFVLLVWVSALRYTSFLCFPYFRGKTFFLPRFLSLSQQCGGLGKCSRSQAV